jgi:hypothetical protein
MKDTQSSSHLSLYFSLFAVVASVASGIWTVSESRYNVMRDTSQDKQIKEALDLGKQAVDHLRKSEVDGVFFANRYLRCEIVNNSFLVDETGFAKLFNGGSEPVKGVTIFWKFDGIDFETDELRGKPALSDSQMEISPNSVVAGGNLVQLEVPMQFELLLPPANRRSVSGEIEVTGEDLHGNDFRVDYLFDGEIAEESGKRILFVQIGERFKLNAREAIKRQLLGND